jgi:hypothetical protein
MQNITNRNVNYSRRSDNCTNGKGVFMRGSGIMAAAAAMVSLLLLLIPLTTAMIPTLSYAQDDVDNWSNEKYADKESDLNEKYLQDDDLENDQKYFDKIDNYNEHCCTEEDG